VEDGCNVATTERVGEVMTTLLWILAVILVNAGIVTAIATAIIGIVLTVVGLHSRPGRVSVFT
jgi:hypothetical protein